jgi:hypothetical protein
MSKTVGEQGLGICLEGDRDLAGKICVGILHGAHTPRLGSETGVVSTEDTDEIWKSVKEEVMEKVEGRANRQVRADSPMIDEAEVETYFWAQRARRMGDKKENKEDCVIMAYAMILF